MNCDICGTSIKENISIRNFVEIMGEAYVVCHSCLKKEEKSKDKWFLITVEALVTKTIAIQAENIDEAQSLAEDPEFYALHEITVMPNQWRVKWMKGVAE